MNYGNIMNGIAIGLERRSALKEFFSKHEGCLLQILEKRMGTQKWDRAVLTEWRAVPGPAESGTLAEALESRSAFEGTPLKLVFTDQKQGGKEYRVTFNNGRISAMNRNAFACTPGLDDGY